ncbi:MAG: DUF4982 domain-containing protein [Clostridia bacterium]|nr:DUF4982 domain-containing protein [Clostridia bacterium]
MREIVDFDNGWYFCRKDIKSEYGAYKGIAYISAKTERYHMGPACKDYFCEPDSYNLDAAHTGEKWERINLPHDYIIDGVPDVKYNNALGFLPYDNAWYVKRFDLSEEDKNKRITLLFEGVATHATVYLNGCLLKHNFCGYNSFEVDITDVVKYNERNHLAVYVNTQNHEGWWYEGGGIYRHVKMIKTDLVSVDLWGIYAKPVYVCDKTWKVQTETTIRNDNVKAKTVKIVGEILDESGNVIATKEISGKIADKDIRTFKYTFDIDDPTLYYPDSPTRYTMKATVFVNGTEVDSDEVKFGFRTFYLDPDKGMFINGKHYKIKGVCGHADCGLMGKAVPDNIHRYKVRLMKEMGANGYRTSHYPQAEALMEELDKNGFIVMDETRWFESTDEGKAQLEMLMKRDRNRACVFFWSVGNEEPHHKTEEGRRIAQTLMSLAHKLDDSRVIMTAVCHSPDKATVYDELEALGINYNWTMYEYVHKKYPKKAVFSSECCATGTTRGWYFDDEPTKAYLPAYDRDSSIDFKGREFTWKYLASNEWLLGGYQWIAFEHRGEAVWPRVCSQSGAIDLFLQKKDAFYQNQSHWLTTPMVHLLPHWNFRGFEGREFRVVAYTNTPACELFLNGVSLGRKEVEKWGHAEWQVAYEPGEIEVVAYDENGQIVATDKKVTSSTPYALKLSLDTDDVKANGKDIAILSCYVVDKDGNEVYDATPTVSFTASGAGKIYSTGSDISEHSSIFLSTRKMRAGRIGVAVKMTNKAGKLTVIAQADGLLPAILEQEIDS